MKTAVHFGSLEQSSDVGIFLTFYSFALKTVFGRACESGRNGVGVGGAVSGPGHPGSLAGQHASTGHPAPPEAARPPPPPQAPHGTCAASPGRPGRPGRTQGDSAVGGGASDTGAWARGAAPGHSVPALHGVCPPAGRQSPRGRPLQRPGQQLHLRWLVGPRGRRGPHVPVLLLSRQPPRAVPGSPQALLGHDHEPHTGPLTFPQFSS